MKKIHILLLFLLPLIIFSACTKDEDRMYVLSPDDATAPALSVEGATNIEVTAETYEMYHSVLSWSRADFGKDIVVEYILEMDTDEDFSTRHQVSLGKGIYAKALSGVDLSNWAIKKFGALDDVTGIVSEVFFSMRIAAVVALENGTVTNKPDTTYSNTISLQLMPYYLVPIVPDYLYIAGNHNGWAQQANLFSPNRDGNYQGYAYLDGEFKFCSTANWGGTNYGSSGGAGQLSTDGGAGNLNSAAGFYWITVDVNGLTYTTTTVSWGIIGEAIGGWDDSDEKVLIFDTTNKVLSYTGAFSAKEFKFRRDGGWGIDLGKGAEDGVLAAGGDNLKITESGTYIIALDLTSDPLKYTYTATKQ